MFRNGIIFPDFVRGAKQGNVDFDSSTNSVLTAHTNSTTNCWKRKETWGKKRGQLALKNCKDSLLINKPTSVEPERSFWGTGQFVTKLRNRLNDESILLQLKLRKHFTPNNVACKCRYRERPFCTFFPVVRIKGPWKLWITNRPWINA